MTARFALVRRSHPRAPPKGDRTDPRASALAIPRVEQNRDRARTERIACERAGRRTYVINGHDDDAVRIAGLDEQGAGREGLERRVHPATDGKARAGQSERDRDLAGDDVRGRVREAARLGRAGAALANARSEQRVRLERRQRGADDDARAGQRSAERLKAGNGREREAHESVRTAEAVERRSRAGRELAERRLAGDMDGTA